MPKSRNRAFHKLRHANGQLRQHVRTYQLQEQVEGLQRANEQLRRQLFQADRTLVAVLAQRGPQEITRGTFEQACEDVNTVWHLEPKAGDENTIVISARQREAATAEAFAPKTNPDFTITRVVDDVGTEAAPTDPTDAALDPA